MLTRYLCKLRSLVASGMLLASSGVMGGCMQRELKPLNPCLISGVVSEIEVNGIDKVDLLFVVDSSLSMLDEQQKLRDQIKPLVETLASGKRPNGKTFPAAKDMHLGVITVDMGVPGGDLPVIFHCGRHDGYGDDGKLQTKPGDPWVDPDDSTKTWDPSPDCAGFTLSQNKFIAFDGNNNDDPTMTAHDLGCLAQVGPGGCGYEMQLEAPLKALWPSFDVDPNTMRQWVDPQTGQPSNRISFLTTQADALSGEQLGNGDRFNANFLRNDKSKGISLISIILITDEDDCSSWTVKHLLDSGSKDVAPEVIADLNNPVPVNLRCLDPNLQQYLWSTDRYTDGLKALRPGNENLVVFAAIAGVPQDLVTPDRLAQFKFDNDGSRADFYSGLRADSRMKPTLNLDGKNIISSCRAANAAPEDTGAFPPTRILDVVEGFGSNGVIQSICENTFGGAIDLIIEVIAKRLGDVCLPRQLVRDASGEVGCNVVWELPVLGEGFDDSPMSCNDSTISGFVKEPDNPAERMKGPHARCVVQQLPVVDKTKPTGQGWYYDDFSLEVMEQCRGADKQRIAFGDTSPPPNGVTVRLECLNEVQSLPQTRTDIDLAAYGAEEPPAIGTSCEKDPLNPEVSQDSMCLIKLTEGQVDASLFCHPRLNICVQHCNSDAECPKAWVCDNRAETVGPMGAGSPICVNPTCGTD